MRILHVDTATEWRGGQNQIVLTAGGQKSRGHDVLVFANRDGELARRAEAMSLPVLRAAVGRGDLSWRTIGALRHAARDFGPDVIHVHESHGLWGSVLAARDQAHRPRLVASRRVDFPLRFLSRLKYARMDRVLAVSRAVREILIAGRLDPIRVVLVPEGVRDRPADPGGSEILRNLGVPAGAPVVGNVAQLVDHKDHATLLRAGAHVLKARPGTHFVICGDGPLRSELEKLTHDLSIQDRVVFAGFRSDLDSLIPSFDVFCLSSHLEGLGTSVIDAMCFARPVVATTAGGIPDSVSDRETGRLVPPRHHEALALALLEVLDDSALARKMGEAGRRRFLASMTDDAMVEKTLAAYR